MSAKLGSRTGKKRRTNVTIKPSERCSAVTGSWTVATNLGLGVGSATSEERNSAVGGGEVAAGPIAATSAQVRDEDGVTASGVGFELLMFAGRTGTSFRVASAFACALARPFARAGLIGLRKGIASEEG